jgi:hypothetical protein
MFGRSAAAAATTVSAQTSGLSRSFSTRGL